MFGRLSPLAIAICAACAIPPAPVPRAEFLIATPDSAFWVKTDANGIHVRGVPMTLARYDGRFHEVYVANLNRSYADAVFTGERLFVRDLMTDDSSLVYEDTAVVRSAAGYAKAHPASAPLDTSDNLPDNPTVSVTGETDILDVRGPYVLFEHRFSIQHGDDEQDDTARSVIDLRSGRPVLTEVRDKRQIMQDSTAVLAFPATWHRTGYDLVARSDLNQDTTAFLLRDPLQRTWHIVTVQGHMRLYWLDGRSIDVQTRRALLHAFNGAAMYDETVKYVRYVPPGAPRRASMQRYASTANAL